MSGQYGFSEEDQKLILEILERSNVDTDAQYREEDDDGNFVPYHREISLHVCDYDDEGPEFEMYIQVD